MKGQCRFHESNPFSLCFLFVFYLYFIIFILVCDLFCFLTARLKIFNFLIYKLIIKHDIIKLDAFLVRYYIATNRNGKTSYFTHIL